MIDHARLAQPWASLPKMLLVFALFYLIGGLGLSIISSQHDRASTLRPDPLPSAAPIIPAEAQMPDTTGIDSLPMAGSVVSSGTVATMLGGAAGGPVTDASGRQIGVVTSVGTGSKATVTVKLSGSGNAVTVSAAELRVRYESGTYKLVLEKPQLPASLER